MNNFKNQLKNQLEKQLSNKLETELASRRGYSHYRLTSSRKRVAKQQSNLKIRLSAMLEQPIIFCVADIEQIG